MKFSCTQEIFAEGLQTVSKAIASHTTLPVLDNILLRAEGSVLYLTATDLEISIETYIDVDIEEEGAITIPAKLLVQYVSLLPAHSTISVATTGGNALAITAPTSNTKIKGIAAEEFPIIPKVEEYFVFQIDRKDFIDALGQTLFSASSNTTRPILAGVFFSVKEKELTLASTDSFRLSQKKMLVHTSDDLEAMKMIVPSKTLGEVMRVFTKDDLKNQQLIVHVARNQVLFECGGTKLTSRLIEGEFPDYKQIIPTEKRTTLVVASSEFLLGLKRVSLFAKENNFNVKFDIKPEEKILALYSDASEIGEEQTSIPLLEVEGEGMKIALNSQYVIEFLNHVGTDTLELACVQPLSAAVFAPCGEKAQVDSSYLHLIMPLRN